MATTENEFFVELKEWSHRKMAIIEKYLDSFATILGKGPCSHLIYVDGFAGKGMYGEEIKGSPVRAAELALVKYPGKLRCIFVEKDSVNCEDLQQHTASFSQVAEVYAGEFSDHADGILRQIGGCASLVFLDAFGVKGADWRTVQKFVSRRNITDVWIRFDHRTVRRLDGFANSAAKDAQGKTALLGEHFGIPDPNLLHRLLDAPTQEERIKKAVSLYQNRLLEVMGPNGFVGAYPIISLNGEKKYHLLFACKSRKAAVLANDIINTVEDSLPIKQAEYAEQIRLNKTRQLSFFTTAPSPDEIFDQKVSELIGCILGLLTTDCETEAMQYEMITQYRNLFGTFRRKHLTKALRSLSNDGMISLSGAPSKPSTIIAKI